jgi:sarcosine oxidase/L-pipecolate oxidase
MALDLNSRIIIIGAGAFGLSTALELSRKGYTSITVLDRSLPPVADGSSVDISRIIRADYGDVDYAKLAHEAYELWLSSELYRPAFHPTPFVIVAEESDRSDVPGRGYVDGCRSVLRSLGLRWTDFNSPDDARAALPALTGELASPGFNGYVTHTAGWADAQRGIELLAAECGRRGVSFIVGAQGTVKKINYDAEGKARSVQTASGLEVPADLVIAAAGAWTAGLAPLEQATISTSQIIGFIHLTDEEAAKLRDLPIYVNLSTGVFMFPPHPETNYLKVACHGFGYTNTQTDPETGKTISVPPPKSIPQRSTYIPDEGARRLKAGVAEILGKEWEDREFEKTAMCWYTETPTGDFIIDRHPHHSNLMMATGGNGHAYKMLPVLGKYVVQALEGTLDPELRAKWRLDTDLLSGQKFVGDGSRGGPPRRELTSEEKSKLTV